MSTEDMEFDILKKYIKVKGLDCNYYRDPYIRRRIKLRVSRTNSGSFTGYLAYLKQHDSEYQELVDCLAVNVTSFFRDVEPYNVLSKRVLPGLADRSMDGGSKRISIWSSACSTGEEPYSVAITVLESIHAKLSRGLKCFIYASDIDKQALDAAIAGEYKELSMSEVDEKIRRRYFVQNGKTSIIKKTVRDMVSFRKLDLISERPIFGMDIIFCRNMLIYINMESQKMIFEKFYEALNPGGYLFLGKTEVLPLGFNNLYKAVDSAERVYQKGA